ncbi:hypothetical protein SLEP1_g49239 [Rubroshorea leprosula]|uniref:Uncharacterized protein n=1 Tax=Rubroshorea leprosula TaxID=152421 RepID=A0AAV5LX53_9ROSI|nr:hypothetical protein SLEP1_g49239 [Rubroshorea leprosula]
MLPLSSALETGWLDDPCLYGTGNFTANSTYHTNLNSLLSSFTDISNYDYGFYNVSAGKIPNQVNGIAMCRGDVKPDDCLRCINDAANGLRDICLTKEASQYYDNCMLRYSDNSILGVRDTNGFFRWGEGGLAKDVNAFSDAQTILLESLRSKAEKGGSFKKFATGKRMVTPSDAIYALVQCTPDLSQLQCGSCLSQAFERIPKCCEGRRGGKIFGPSCTVRFDDLLFYNASVADVPSLSPSPSPDSPPPPRVPSPPSNKSSSPKTTVIIVISTIGFILFISICICIFFRVTKSEKKFHAEAVDDEIQSVESLQFDFNIIRDATNNFSDENKLGQGGFGAVYKGRLANGQEIAVKRLSISSGQGDLEFKNEVQLVAKLQHRNLVKLHGFCLEGKERLLIYEFVPNSSLDHFLFDPIKRTQLHWQTRCKIIGGIAKGLLYLHEDSRLRIIHRDLKAGNVLLDGDMNPKISDFGMARLFVVDQTQDATSKVVGTYGYMAPEYVLQGQLSVKTDVYSFGVLILEIVSGQKINHACHEDNVTNLISVAWRNWREGTPLNIRDPNLSEGSTTEILRYIHIGLLCVQENVARRPTISSIVVMLTSYSVTLPTPSRPSFFMYSATESGMAPASPQGFNLEATQSHQPRNESALASINDVSITELEPR